MFFLDEQFARGQSSQLQQDTFFLRCTMRHIIQPMAAMTIAPTINSCTKIDILYKYRADLKYYESAQPCNKRVV